MPSLQFPTDTQASQQEVLRRIAEISQADLVAHIRVLVAYIDDEWRPICGRIDVALPQDAPAFPVRPRTSVRLLFETVPLSELTKRLDAAFRKQPFPIRGESVTGHGMEAAWGGEHHPEDWPLYGTTWPAFTFAPMQGVGRPVLSWEAIEADGSSEAIDGIEDCVRFTMGYIERSRGGGDVRFNRFQVVVWDYRGVIRMRAKNGVLSVAISPRKHRDLTLAIVVGDTKGRQAKRRTAASRLRIPIRGTLRRVNATLRHGTEIVCHALWDKAQEDAIARMNGHYRRVPSAPEIVEPDTVSTVSKLVMGFVSDPKLGAMVTRDLDEIDLAIRARAFKAALLLIGSVLEAALLDVAARNEPEVRKRLKNKWPERASLRDLIDFLAGVQVQTPTISAPLLPPLTSKKGDVIVEHRDLIHPRAEVRGAAQLDEHVVTTMHSVLREVMRDLRQAHADGLIDAYVAGSILP